MIKYLIVYFFLLTASVVYGGKSFHFPDLDFEYAKIYYFNLGEIKTRPDDYIYTKESGFAKSIAGEGKMSSDALTANVEKLFLYHKDALINGLSGCYIPRHGVVYFDKNDKPVASLSICFECGAIRMWTKDKGKIKSSDRKATEAGNQLNTLKKFVEKEGIKVYKNPEDYKHIMNPAKATITIDFEKLDSNIVSVSYRDAIEWFKTPPKTSVDTEYTAGGKKYNFGTLEAGNSTKLLFISDKTDAKLGEATIDNEQVVLPNGIKIGSTLDDVLNTLLVYDGPSNPAKITLQDASNKIVYNFENRILVLITINK